MPRYEFYCDLCQIKFEVLKAVDNRDTHECPSCGNLVVLVMSVVNNTFGFRLTDACHERGGPKNEYERDV